LVSYSASQKKAAPKKTFYDVFTCGEPVKIVLVIAQIYS